MGKNKKNKSNAGARAEKKSLVTENKRKKDNSIFIGAGIALAAIAVAAFIVFSAGSAFKPVSAEAGVVKLSTAEVNDGKAHFYSYDAGGKEINFFVLKSSDGIIRAAFDACDVCFQERKGYRQEGDIMVCNNCGQRFPSVKINEIRGGCNPAPLNRRTEGEYVVFNVGDILQGGYYF